VSIPQHVRRSCAARLATLLLAGCTVGPDHVVPQTPLPGSWPGLPPGTLMLDLPPDGAAPATGDAAQSAQSAQAAQAAQAAALAAEAGLSRWWKAFGDATLDALVEQALAGNLDLQRAQARVLEARALRRQAGAEGQPTLDAHADASRAERSENNTTSTNIPGATRSLFLVGFDALWELDVFGGIRRGIEAAEADLAAAQETRRDVLVTLLGDVAREYLDLRSAQRRLALARENLSLQEDTLELTQARARAGLASDLDVARAEALAARTRASIPPLQTAERAALHRLDVLTGRNAGESADTLLVAGALPPPPPRVPLGLPSELLRRRPDIRVSERNLAAATARVGVATAELWPKFSLTGTLGLSAERTSELFDTDSRFWSLGGGLDWPVLDAGLRRAGVQAAEARAQDALLAYRQVVLTAFEEAANALVAYGREQERRQTLLAGSQAQRRAAELALDLHEAGLADFLDVLVAQSQRLDADDALALSERDLSADYVALCKALGGGWDVLPPDDGAGGED
jgi:outer membrane protein, multidrug efflux system